MKILVSYFNPLRDDNLILAEFDGPVYLVGYTDWVNFPCTQYVTFRKEWAECEFKAQAEADEAQVERTYSRSDDCDERSRAWKARERICKEMADGMPNAYSNTSNGELPLH